jgi:hypothetical protein
VISVLVAFAGEVGAGFRDVCFFFGMPVYEILVITALATVDEQDYMVGLERLWPASIFVTVAHGVPPFLSPIFSFGQGLLGA